MKKPKFRQELKSSFKDWILDSTSHGFPKIFKTNRLITKIMWIICLCASIGLCAYMIASAIMGFFQYEVTTKIRQKTEIPIDLPALSICQNEMFLTEEGRNFVDKVLLKNGIDGIFNSSFFQNNFKSDYQESFNILMLSFIARIHALEYNMSIDVQKSFGFK